MATMKIDLASDLHLEFGDLPIDNRNGADVLILAGDICVAEDLHNFPESDTVLPSTGRRAASAARYRAFFRRVCEIYPHVIFIAGNHEHYHGNFDQTHDIFHTEFERMNLPIRLLERETAVINGVTFIGATLWTDFNKHDPVSMYECGSAMNDYHKIRLALQEYRRLRPQDTLDEHLNTKNYILDILSKTQTPVVVVGHHAPSTLSVKPQYESEHHINGAYRSDLSGIMLDNPQIRLWVHGHTHHDFDYVIGSTRVVCHPRGYVGYERGTHEQDPYYPQTIELEIEDNLND